MLTDNADDVQYEEASKPHETIYEENKTTNKSEETVENKDKTQSGKYDWVGNLVVSQIEDIDSVHRGDFVWDVQCLLRKYLLKSKITKEQAQSNKSNEEEATTTKDVTLHKGSNISVNVNFL